MAINELRPALFKVSCDGCGKSVEANGFSTAETAAWGLSGQIGHVDTPQAPLQVMACSIDCLVEAVKKAVDGYSVARWRARRNGSLN